MNIKHHISKFRCARFIAMVGIAFYMLAGCSETQVQQTDAAEAAKDQWSGRQTKSYGVKLADDKPEFAGFWLDSLGKGRTWPSAMLAGNLKQTYRKESSDGWVNYYPTGRSDARTRFKFDNDSFWIRSEVKTDNAVEPFVLKFKADGPNPAYATLLGKMEKGGAVKLPAVLHIPGQGTIRITAKSEKKIPLHFEYEGDRKLGSEEASYRQIVKITFPAASKECNWIEFKLEAIKVYPKIADLEKDVRFDGYRRCWLNMLQLSAKHGMLANNVASDVCGLVYHKYSEIAMLSRDLADGVSGPQLLRASLDRFLAGKKGYGMPGYHFGDYPVISLDTWPSLLIAAHNYYQASGDDKWVMKNIDKLLEWGNESFKTDSNGNGLIEFHQSGNTGECRVRPANWWDCINFGHEDAYSNALAYRGFRGLAKMAKVAGKNEQSKKFANAADKLKSSYYKTFYNPKTNMLAGWKSKDGELHDYYFTFIQGMAITYGLVDDEKKANDLLDATLKKMKEVGFDRFDLGLPGNLVNVPQEDYYEAPARWGGANAFQVYENGGASANHTYFFIAALYKLGRQEDGDRILLPMLDSFDNCRFQGRNPGEKYTNDWLAWDGSPHGYEGILVDGYLAAKAVLVRQGLVDPEWGSMK